MAYSGKRPRIQLKQILADLNSTPRCIKLRSHWDFENCGYRKSTVSCNSLADLPRCHLPKKDLRNGTLNQTAYSMALFFRDIAENDFVTWLDRTLLGAIAAYPDQHRRWAWAVQEPLCSIFGISHKLVTMSMSVLLLAADPKRDHWAAAGGSMIAVDSLVHNWLLRSGIMSAMDADHAYGPGCYAKGNCADIVARVSRRIDVRRYNPEFPAYLPRFVQHATWRFCAQSGVGQCNGLRIDDSARCKLRDCALFGMCRRQKLGRVTPSQAPV